MSFFVKLSPSPSPSWAELVIISAFPATPPPTRPPDHPEKSKIASAQYNLQYKSCLYQLVGPKNSFGS